MNVDAKGIHHLYKQTMKNNVLLIWIT